MAQEIERKFLVRGEFKSQAFKQSRMIQGYICNTNSRTVRVRISDNQGFLTIKGPTSESGVTRYEWEREISLPDAHELMQLCQEGVISKTRFYVHSGSHIFEIDEFHDTNQGLIVAEVELLDEHEEFVKPDFIGEEVTGDVRYYNSQLMKHPYTTW